MLTNEDIGKSRPCKCACVQATSAHPSLTRDDAPAHAHTQVTACILIHTNCSDVPVAPVASDKFIIVLGPLPAVVETDSLFDGAGRDKVARDLAKVFPVREEACAVTNCTPATNRVNLSIGNFGAAHEELRAGAQLHIVSRRMGIRPEHEEWKHRHKTKAKTTKNNEDNHNKETETENTPPRAPFLCIRRHTMVAI